MFRFIAKVPQTVQPGDKVRVRGVVDDDAKEFSINFVNDCCPSPQDITYHFKWMLKDRKIVENYKQNGHWMEHQEIDYDELDGWLTNSIKSSNFSSDSLNNDFISTNANGNSYTDDYINSYSIVASSFGLEFVFQDDGICVYLIYEDGCNNINMKYLLKNELSDIQSVQVWGDVRKVTELAFMYK